MKQVASGRFGVTAKYLSNAEELEIKIAQGAKPGEGGNCPASRSRLYRPDATRHSWLALISPPPHHDIYTIEDLAQLIYDLQDQPPRNIGVKLVAEAGVGTVAAGVAKARADYILIAGHSGGTGASPANLDQARRCRRGSSGLPKPSRPWCMNELRSRVGYAPTVACKTGRDVVIGRPARGRRIRFRHLAAHRHRLRHGAPVSSQHLSHRDRDPARGFARKFTGKPEDVIGYLLPLTEEVRERMAELGAARSKS